MYRLRHVRSVYLETAVSARESKFIEPRDSSIRPSLLCQDICSLALFRGIELEITIKHPTWFDAISSYLVPFLYEISCAEWSGIPRIVSQQLVYILPKRPDNFLGKVNRIRVPI